jgi:hypothetical protein
MENLAVDPGRRAARYWNIDGLAELYIGLVWLSAALYLYAEGHLPRSSPWYKPLVLGGTLGWMAAIFAGQWVVGVVKRRVTYPRTGYVACAKPKAKPYWLALVLAAILLPLPFAPPWLVMPLTGLAFAVISTGVNRRMGFTRVYVFGGLMLILGSALGIAGLDLNAGLGVMFAAAGAASLLSGGWTLWHYLHLQPERA